jgi:calcineurin-like phosphoesterase family protein
MDDTLIEKWNSVIKTDDIVYHLGDFGFGNDKKAKNYFLKLNGKIRVLSNVWHHDKRWLLKCLNQRIVSRSQVQVEFISPLIVLELDVLKSPSGWIIPIVLCHYPMAIWDRKHYGAWHLHGHSHCHYQPTENDLILDVGVDCHDYCPVSLDDVKVIMSEKIKDVQDTPCTPDSDN